MNCANHPEVAATTFCRKCEKPMCTDCQRPALGSVYCAKHKGDLQGVYISDGVEVNLRFDDGPTSVEEQRDKVLRWLPRGLRELEIEGILHKGVREKGKSLGYFHRHPLMGGKPIKCPSCGRALEPGKYDYELHLTDCPCGWCEACPGCGSLLFRQDSHLTQCPSCGWYDLTEAESITRVTRFAVNSGYGFWQRPESGALLVILFGVVLIPLAIAAIFLLGRLAALPGYVSAIVVLVVAYFLPRAFVITTERVSSYLLTGARFWLRHGGRLAMAAFISGLSLSLVAVGILLSGALLHVPLYISVLAIVLVGRYLFTTLAQWDFGD